MPFELSIESQTLVIASVLVLLVLVVEIRRLLAGYRRWRKLHWTDSHSAHPDRGG